MLWGTAACDYSSVERINRDHINPVLRDLVHTPFFQYFKVDLYSECPFWPDDGMCMLRDCGVCECEPDEVPDIWRKAETQEADPDHCGETPDSGWNRLGECGVCNNAYLSS